MIKTFPRQIIARFAKNPCRLIRLRNLPIKPFTRFRLFIPKCAFDGIECNYKLTKIRTDERIIIYDPFSDYRISSV